MRLSVIKTIGVVGCGTMGFGISVNFALWGYPVVAYDLNELILDKGRQRIEKGLKILVDEGLIDKELPYATMKRITLTTNINQLADTDFITEAITERLSDKQEIFNKLDKICKPETIIASNTSGFVMSDIAKGVKRQDKILLNHYFDPPHIVPAVEVAKGPGTSDETYEIIFELMKRVKKVPIRVLKERPGYLLNTIQAAMENMALRLWADGVASAEDIEKGIVASFGFRGPHEGPMMHFDLAGIWKWPKDILAMRAERFASMPKLSEEGKKRLIERAKSGKPWFFDPAGFEDAVEARDREYARRLKDLYWGKIE